ncbi:MAG: hypothetical protein ACI9MN_001523, partial [Saprospiraceae bacterium]
YKFWLTKGALGATFFGALDECLKECLNKLK